MTVSQWRRILLISLLFLGVYMVLWFIVRRAAERMGVQHEEIIRIEPSVARERGDHA